ncbi:hypothetical protein Tco_0320863 [Tanacetum coccineum]
MITDEIKQTEHYRMYLEVFEIDVPLTQSQPNESTHRTHRTTSAPSLHQQLLVPNVDKADEMILQDALQVSLAEHKSHEEILNEPNYSLGTQDSAQEYKKFRRWRLLMIRKCSSGKKTSEYEAYVSGESSSGQDLQEELAPSTSGNQEQDDDFDFWTDSYASDDDEIPSKQVSQDIIEEVSLTIDEAKLRKMADEMLRQRSIIFNDDDIEEPRTSRWVNKCVKKFNPYARYGVEHWKNPHAKIFYIRKQKEPGKPKEEIYSNSKIIQPDYKNLNKNDIEDIYLLIMNGKKVNLTAPTMTFPGIEDHEMFSIIYEPVHGIIYKNSKKEKRVMRHSEIHKFCDATLNRVLEGDGEDEPSDDDDDDDTDDEDEEPFKDEDDDEEEEHLALADSSAVPVVDPVPLAGDTKAFETNESAPTPRSPQTKVSFSQTRLRRARKTVRLEPPMSPSMEARIAEYAAAPTPPSPPPSPLSPWSYLLPQIPSPPLPPPPSSLYLPPSVPTSLPLPSSPLPPLPASIFIPLPVDRREDIPEAELPPRKRLCPTTPTSRYEVGESSTAAPRPTRGYRADYGFIGTIDAEIRR